MIFLILALYILCPILSTPLLIYIILNSNKHFKVALFLLSLNLGLVGYYFVPDSTMDLYRHFEKLSLLGNLNFQGFLIYNENNPLYAENFLFYFVAQLDNINILPLIAGTFTYYLVFYVIVDFQKKQGQLKSIILFSMIFIFTWYPIILPISGIRFSLALAITFYSLYKIYYNQKSFYYIGLIFAAFLHLGVILILTLIVVLKINKLRFRYFIIVVIGFILSVQPVLDLLSIIPFEYTRLLAFKVEAYLVYETTELKELLNVFKWMMCFGLIVLLTFKRKDLLKRHSPEFIKLVYSISVIALVMYYLPILVERYGDFLLVTLPLLLVGQIQKVDKNIRVIIYMFNTLLLLVGVYFNYLQVRMMKFDITLSEFIFKTFLFN